MNEHFYSGARLIEALRTGLPSSEWQQYARSRKSLHVRIHGLREKGYGISAVTDPHGGSGHPVTYHLLYEPDQPKLCPTCGKPG